MKPTVIEAVAAYFHMTPPQFLVFFGLASAVTIIGVVIACIHLSAVPPVEGETPKRAA